MRDPATIRLLIWLAVIGAGLFVGWRFLRGVLGGNAQQYATAGGGGFGFNSAYPGSPGTVTAPGVTPTPVTTSSIVNASGSPNAGPFSNPNPGGQWPFAGPTAPRTATAPAYNFSGMATMPNTAAMNPPAGTPLTAAPTWVPTPGPSGGPVGGFAFAGPASGGPGQGVISGNNVLIGYAGPDGTLYNKPVPGGVAIFR